uniref:Uncharacterized protein n=1 Tax=Buteo japonicus TaxID=224669 RepID=A0A8B9Z186_9AVES
MQPSDSLHAGFFKKKGKRERLLLTYGIDSRLRIWQEKLRVWSVPDLQHLSPRKVSSTAMTVLTGARLSARRALPARPASRGIGRPSCTGRSPGSIRVEPVMTERLYQARVGFLAST